MHSCIYEGTVQHRRFQPIVHEFQYRLYLVYLDLDELPSLVGSGCLLSDNKAASRSFQRGDHLFDSKQSLRNEVLSIARKRTGHDHRGPIRVLTQLRHFGFYFSPLNLFYLFDPAGERVETVVAEVSNTPWNERHCYVLWNGNRDEPAENLRFSHPKQFHVSPFMDMDLTYRWNLSQPKQRLRVQLENITATTKMFEARMLLQRRELSRTALRRMSLNYPLMTAQISAAIYYQAWKLWWKKCPYYPHPKKVLDTTIQTR